MYLDNAIFLSIEGLNITFGQSVQSKKVVGSKEKFV